MSAEELQQEVDELRQQLKQLELRQKSEVKPPPVYIKSDRKIPKLAGRPVKENDPEVDEWVTDMREHLSSLPSNESKIDFVLDHLAGSAKSEVRLRPPEMKRTADDILKIIEDVYKPQDTLTQLRHKFYERTQHENENLEAYSLALMKMMNQICKKEGTEVSSQDNVLIEKFIDGIKDPQLKRELRRFSIENTGLPFFEFRGRVLLWVDDQELRSEKTANVNKQVAERRSTNDEILEMMRKQQELLEKQQQQIDVLTQLTQRRNFQSSRG